MRVHVSIGIIIIIHHKLPASYLDFFSNNALLWWLKELHTNSPHRLKCRPFICLWNNSVIAVIIFFRSGLVVAARNIKGAFHSCLILHLTTFEGGSPGALALVHWAFGRNRKVQGSLQMCELRFFFLSPSVLAFFFKTSVQIRRIFTVLICRFNILHYLAAPCRSSEFLYCFSDKDFGIFCWNLIGCRPHCFLLPPQTNERNATNVEFHKNDTIEISTFKSERAALFKSMLYSPRLPPRRVIQPSALNLVLHSSAWWSRHRDSLTKKHVTDECWTDQRLHVCSPPLPLLFFYF